MKPEGGMQPRPWQDVENLDRNVVQAFEKERKYILHLADRGLWTSVLKILRQEGGDIIARELPMNNVDDSILHIAASNGQTEVVRFLLQITKKDEEPVGPLDEENANVTGNTLLHLAAAMGHEDTCKCIVDMVPQLVNAKNKYGNTPLHLAAAMGLEDACKYMADKAPGLAKARNTDGETPIFMAALSGYKGVFITLASSFLHDPEIALARREDGDTILHCAISGEYFDFACTIVDSYRQLIYCRNDRGLTPLHLLANNPAAFRSGCQLGLLDRFLYSSIKVSTESKSDYLNVRDQKQEECAFELPGNYFMCWSFFNLWRNIFATLGGQSRCLRGASSCNRHTSERPVSVTKFFGLFFKILLEVWLLILAISGFSERITRMRKEKQKHIWAKEVMKQLIRNIDHWREFGEINYGMDPFKDRLEWTRDFNPGATPRVEEIPSASLEEKEIASKADTNIMQERQLFHTTGSQPQQDPQTRSNKHSSPIDTSPNQLKEDNKRGIIQSPFLVAGKKGVIEMVETIIKTFPIAIHDMDFEHKNIMLLAAEHRQPEIYMFVLERKNVSLHGKVDVEGNSVLHLAAKHPQNKELLIRGAVLQMQREIKWFKFVKESMPPHFSKRLNYEGKTAIEVFTDTHHELAVQRAKWLGKASQSCSVVATLITTVAFATISSVPGGLLQDKGLDRGAPVFRGRLAFSVFSVSSLLALVFSAISLIMCLGILTSPYKDLDFGNELPKKLIGALASLFISIAAMFLSFFSGDLFVLVNKMSYIAYATLVPASFVAFAGFLLYVEFIRETVNPVPKRTYPHRLLYPGAYEDYYLMG